MSAGKVLHRLAVPAILIVASLGACLLLLELGLRLFGYDAMSELGPSGRGVILRESDNPLRGYELAPNASGSAWRTRVRTNAHGMRDRDRPIARSAAPRVVVLGDSVTFGSGVAARDRFTNQLEGLLAERSAGPAEVLNLAVGGYDTLQEVATLEDVGLRFSPDLVVLAYCVNDVGDNSPNLAYIRRLRRLESPLFRLRAAQLVNDAVEKLRLIWLLDASNRDENFAETFRGFIDPVSGDRELMALRAELAEWMSRVEDADFRLDWYLSEVHLGKLAYSLSRLARVAHEHDLDAIVAILPFLDEGPRYDVVYRMVEHLARREGLEVISLAPALAPAGLASLRSRPRDPIHPNERGHRLIAEALAPRVAARLLARAPRVVDGAASPEAGARSR